MLMDKYVTLKLHPNETERINIRKIIQSYDPTKKLGQMKFVDPDELPLRIVRAHEM